MIQEGIAGEVKAELGRQDQSQRDLARALGWTEAKLSRRLNGHVPWSVAEVELIASVLDVPRAQFLNPPLQHQRAAS